MTEFPIDVLGSGAVLLGGEVVCDGFHRPSKVRVQSHVHDDHMRDFETSKGFQDLVMSEGTYRLLAAEYNADLPVRRNGGNLFAVNFGEAISVGNSRVTLMHNDHMLGSSQVLVETHDGMRLGYSSDFAWPLDAGSQMQCDALVVDGTYGSPNSIRRYSQAEAETKFVNLMRARLVAGPVHLRAYRGTIQRAVQLICNEIDVPIVGSPDLCKQLGVYQHFGAVVGAVLSTTSSEGAAAMASGRYVRLFSKGDRMPVDPNTISTVVLSAYMVGPEDPVMEYSERGYRVALSDHADFDGTLEYIVATGARLVVTDNTRGGHGIVLAQAVKERLGIEARPSSNKSSHEWGY